MTGSLSVRGDFLPVGGVNAKIEAAISAGVKKVIIPESNKKDVMVGMKNKVKIVPVKSLSGRLRKRSALRRV